MTPLTESDAAEIEFPYPPEPTDWARPQKRSEDRMGVNVPTTEDHVLLHGRVVSLEATDEQRHREVLARVAELEARIDALVVPTPTPTPTPDPTPDPPVVVDEGKDPPVFSLKRSGILRGGANGTMGAIAFDRTRGELLVGGRKNDHRVYRYNAETFEQTGVIEDISGGAVQKLAAQHSNGAGFGGLLVLQDGRIAFTIWVYYNVSNLLVPDLGIYNPRTGETRLYRTAGEARGTYGHQVAGGPLASYLDPDGVEWIVSGASFKQGSASSSAGGACILLRADGPTVDIDGETLWDDVAKTWRDRDHAEPGHDNVRELDGRIVVGGEWHLIFGSRGKIGSPDSGVEYGTNPLHSKGYFDADGYEPVVWGYQLSEQLEAVDPQSDSWEVFQVLTSLMPEANDKRHSVIGAAHDPDSREAFAIVSAVEGSDPKVFALGY